MASVEVARRTGRRRLDCRKPTHRTARSVDALEARVTKKIDVPDLVELLRQKQHRIVMQVADGYFGHDLAEVEVELRRRLDGTGASSAAIAEWARLISESRPPR